MLPFPDATVYRGIASVAADRPDEVAVVEGDARPTYDDLLAASRDLAGALAALGGARRHRLALGVTPPARD
jgi:fatty-acyl-CoA synthase